MTRVLLLFILLPLCCANTCRDRFLWPFDQSSIWNTAIGSGAKYLPAEIYADELPSEIHNDQEWIIRAREGDPLADWQDDSGDFPGLCNATGPVKARLPLPRDLSTDCVANNNAAALLLPDNRTLVQFQPFYRPKPGGPFVAWYHTGAPQPFPWQLDILGDGMHGAHGGSGLSALGGSIRKGELMPQTMAITHALKIELWAHRYYWWNWSSQEYSSCFTWPAVGCDSYYNSSVYGYNGTNPFLRPGALLAIPPSDAALVALSLSTSIGHKLLAALTDYGAYLVDDTGSQQGGGAFCAEPEVSDEVQREFGYSLRIENPLSPMQGAPLYDDFVALFRALHVVVNNSPGNVGGGGIPRQPPPPPICDV